MLEFFYEITVGVMHDGVRDILRGDWFGIIPLLLGIVMIILCIMLVGLIFSIVYDMIDTSGPTKIQLGTVSRTRFEPAHVTQVYNAVTKTFIPIFHPPRWYAAFKVSGANEEITISKDLFEKLQKGDQMNMLVTQGKLSKCTRIVGLAG